MGTPASGEAMLYLAASGATSSLPSFDADAEVSAALDALDGLSACGSEAVSCEGDHGILQGGRESVQSNPLTVAIYGVKQIKKENQESVILGSRSPKE